MALQPPDGHRNVSIVLKANRILHIRCVLGYCAYCDER